MAPVSEQLQDDQKFALMKFRRTVHDILKPNHDDRYLLRWLRARNWNTDAAEKMLRDSMEWRKKWEVDTTLKSYEQPEVFKKYIPSGVPGVDSEGTPVIFLPFVGFDVWGLLHTVSKTEIIKQVIVLLEDYLGRATNDEYKASVVIDLDNFNIKQYAWKPAAELVISLIQMYEANYPEILKTCYIINAPSIFSMAFNIIKQFMGEYTINKIHIYKADPKKWEPVLRANIPLNILPKYFGGEAVDPDGDIRCSSKIKQGGKIPKELYDKNRKAEESTVEYTSDIVKKGKQLCLHYIVTDEGCVLSWDFSTEGHDIKFGVNCENAEGNQNVVIPIHKVNSNLINEIGAINCDYPATYTVIFDNSYSMLRSKKIFYNIQLLLPQGKLNELNLITLPENISTENIDTAL